LIVNQFQVQRLKGFTGVLEGVNFLSPFLPWFSVVNMGYPPPVGGFCSGFVLGCFFCLGLEGFCGFELEIVGKRWLLLEVLEYSKNQL
jgi:hypothetical protein